MKRFKTNVLIYWLSAKWEKIVFTKINQNSNTNEFQNKKTKNKCFAEFKETIWNFDKSLFHCFLFLFSIFLFFIYFLNFTLKWKLKNNWFKPFCNFCGNFHNVPFRWDYSINFDENCWQKFNYLQFIIMNFHDNWQ